jgi:hypothetical protein
MQAHEHGGHAHMAEEAMSALAAAVAPAAAVHEAAGDAAAAMHAMRHGADFTWRPTIDASDCRFHGLVAHALILGGLAMCALPHAVAARQKLHFLGVALLLFLSACVFNGVQRTCLRHGGHTALRGGNMHEVLGWLFVTLAVVASVAFTFVSSGATQRYMRIAERAALRASTALLGLAVPLGGWCLTAVTVVSALLLLSGMWSALNCFDSPGFVGYEIGACTHCVLLPCCRGCSIASPAKCIA